MKRLMALMALLLGLASSASAVSSDQATLSNKRAAYAYTQDVRVEDYSNFSIQVDLADAAPATVSFVGGAKSSDNVTVSSYDGLIGRKSSATITIMSGQNEALAGTILTVNGFPYVTGTHWTVGYTSTATAAALAAALDAHWQYSATASSNVVTLEAADIGTAGNSFTLTTSDAAKLAKTAWSAGQENGYINIGGTTLTHGTDFTAVTSSHTTANAIAVAINANAALSALISVSSATEATSPLTAGIIQLISKENGYNPLVVSVSNTSHLLPDYPRFQGGKNSDVDFVDNTITEAAHNLPVGLGVVYSTGSNLAITGLTFGTTYYVVPVDANSFKLSDTAAHAYAGTNIADLSAAGDATFVLAPQPLSSAATDGITYLGSNDGTTFYSVTQSSVPYDAASTGALTPFVDFTGRYLRLSFVAPTRGALNVNAIINGRK